MKKVIYVLMFVFGLGVHSNAEAFPKTVFLRNAAEVQEFLDSDLKDRELVLYVDFYGEPFLTPEMLERLKNAFAKNTVIELSLKLARNAGDAVDLESLQRFLPLLAEFTDLTKFSVHSGNPEAAEIILQHLHLLPASLKRLDMSSNGMRDDLAAELASQLSSFQDLTYIGFYLNNLTNASAAVLGQAFAALPSLKRVQIWKNNIEDPAGFFAEIKTMPGNENLRIDVDAAVYNNDDLILAMNTVRDMDAAPKHNSFALGEGSMQWNDDGYDAVFCDEL